MSVPVLTVFDVRGIQEFIFRTNAVKEIIGGSLIVKEMLMECFKSACNDVFEKEMDFKWENRKFTFDRLGDDMKIIYEGGGNIVALFTDTEKYKKVYRRMNETILEKTYSLSIASACTEMTGNYNEDRKRLQQELEKAERKTPPIILPRGISATKRDAVTGLPLSEKIRENGGYKLVSKETKLKLAAYKKIKNSDDEIETNNKQNNEEASAKENFRYMLDLDEMALEKGEESLLAIVHIDGNNMANAISSVLENKTDYKDAVGTIRKLSQHITKTFTEDAFYKLPAALETELEKEFKKNNSEKPEDNKKIEKPVLPMRKIICAGDDITFICNARLAIPLTEMYLKEIVKFGDGAEKNMEFSACAGIAFIHSHFPFSLAYRIAEECCANAKMAAKAKEDDKQRGFMDFHFCFSGVTGDLEQIRENQYISQDGNSLLRRPWQVTGKEKDALKYIEMLRYFAGFFSADKVNIKENSDNNSSGHVSYDTSKWPGTRVKEFRNTHFSKKHDLEEILKQYSSRGYNLPKYNASDELFNNNQAVYYDSLEISDIYCTIEEFAQDYVCRVMKQKEGEAN
jgi:hypothetical protein